MSDPIFVSLGIILVVLFAFVMLAWVVVSWSKAWSRSYIIDHFDSINQKLNPFGFMLEYGVSDGYDEQVVHMFRLLDTRSGLSSPWASSTVARSWISRMKNESVESVFADAQKYDIHRASKRKPLPFDVVSKRMKK